MGPGGFSLANAGWRGILAPVFANMKLMRISTYLGTVAVAAGMAAFTTMSQEFKPDSNQQVLEVAAKTTRDLKLKYLLFLPKDYAAKPDKTWPLLLFLHGAGERGTNIWLVTKHGPPKIVRDKPDFPFLVASPQCPSGQVWQDDALLALLDQVTAGYRVDKARIYLTGLSMGGYGSWSLAVAHPERFAAVAPICGGGDIVRVLLAEGAKAEALRSLPVWAFHGGKDNVVKVAESERMVATLKQFGCKAVELTVYPEAGHDSWTESYNNPKLYDWFLSHQRRPAARKRTKPRATRPRAVAKRRTR